MKHDYTQPEIWNTIWSRPYENYKKHHQVFWNLIREKATGKVLDMACGAANYWNNLDIELYGCDFSDSAITEAVKNNPKGHFLVDEIPTNYYDNMGFDTVVMSGLVNYYPDLRSIMAMAMRASKREALILITINVIDDFPNRHWDINEIKKQFSSYGRVTSHWEDGIGWFIAIRKR